MKYPKLTKRTVSNLFNRNYKRYDAWYDRNKFAYLSELGALKEALPKKGRGLEIGVGTARFAAPLGIRFGIDPAEKMLEIAQKRGIKTRLGEAEKLPFKNSTFDYAAIIVSLCFVKDPQKTLKEAARVLKRKGRIIIGIVDKESFLGKYYRREKSVFYKQAKFLSGQEVADLLKETGFISISYYQTISVLPEKMISVEKPRKNFGKGGFVVISAKKP